MSGRLAGKTALVTGAAAGIGRAVADRFVAEGARVAYADRDVAGAEAAAAASGGRAVPMDVTDEDSVAGGFAALAADGWVPEVVVVNAGVQLFGQDAEVADLDLDVWRRTHEVNLTGAFLTVKHAVRGMLGVGGGSIVFTGSPTAVRGEGAEFTAYASSKAGMHGLARTVAAAYARRGIRVNTVVPPYTETGLVSTLTDDPEARAAIVGRIPMGRAGTTGDLEGVMVFLASDESAFATGATFAVDGGMTTL
ncbi:MULTISPECIES: SDR family NAD(P)-dependent oxidoreductase [Modestobacter]|uniref:Dehydrogenase n=1 Tax=Modestobacter caceresii TaxID=1522368 RepID=A0A098YG28_9ACTN|nr:MULTISPECIES: SDR family NAD(P)-dependent oxidoreductase [Modestobacter]KGH48736.1 dehydrogenase [Modestobacter caceresii]